MKYYIYISIIAIILGSCSSSYDSQIEAGHQPAIYPDYKDICIPVNIAPLNFQIKAKCDELLVEVKGNSGSINAKGENKISFNINDFKELLNNNNNDTLWVSVSTITDNKLTIYDAFFWKVIPDSIDEYLTYRLIEPGYEVWNTISMAQRNISNFDENYITDNNLTGGMCMNCHVGSKQNPEKSFFHIRGKKGMTVIADGKKLRKLDTKPKGAYSNLIYGNWHPSGKYIAFSTNKVLPSIHTYRNKRAFVYDTLSDVVVLDLQNNQIITSPLTSKKNQLETFPEFSSDGKTLYFCSANKVRLPKDHDSLKYSLLSIDFNQEEGSLGNEIDTLISNLKTGKSLSQIKASPDGKFIYYTSLKYGTFPIWHADAKIYSYNIETKNIDTLPNLNNNRTYSNSYHSLSTNSRWIVFASKRDNGLYGKPYFSYIDKTGKAHKPFVLPQKNAELYDYTYKSYNLPELYKTPRSFDAYDIEKLFNDNTPNEQVVYKNK